MSELPEVEWLTTLQLGLWDWHGYCLKGWTIPGYSRDAFVEGRYLPKTATTPQGVGAIQQESTFWRRSLWEKMGAQVSTEFKLASDFDLWGRFFEFAELYGVECPLSGFRLQQHQKSQQVELYLSEALRSLRRYQTPQSIATQSRRHFFYQSQLYRLAAIRQGFRKQICYPCKKIVRQNPSSPQASWRVQEYDAYF